MVSYGVDLGNGIAGTSLTSSNLCPGQPNPNPKHRFLSMSQGRAWVVADEAKACYQEAIEIRESPPTREASYLERRLGNQAYHRESIE